MLSRVEPVHGMIHLQKFRDVRHTDRPRVKTKSAILVLVLASRAEFIEFVDARRHRDGFTDRQFGEGAADVHVFRVFLFIIPQFDLLQPADGPLLPDGRLRRAVVPK